MTLFIVLAVLGALLAFGRAAEKKRSAQKASATSTTATTSSGKPEPTLPAKVFATLVLLGIAYGVGAFIVHIFSAATPSASSPHSTSQQTDTNESPVIEVSAVKLYRAYDHNEILADTQYKGKRLLIQGTLARIDKDFADNSYLTLESGQMFMGVHANIRNSELPKAATLSKGDTVSLLCIGGGRVIGSPIADDCVLR